jgi:eukaryotic-like serine/threonine-protein kinase
MMREGDRIAERFELEQFAGAGGMGEVYRARDLHSGESVAIKILRQGISPQQQARFISEGRILAELRHPAIVRYVDHGITSKGEPYLVMAWLEGEDLGTRLCREGLTVAETVALGIRVAEALGAAHMREIVHRDLKPGNLFLPQRALSACTLIDFGIARLAYQPRVTRTGVILGTPGYMAPEQVRGKREVDARTDVFALGCTLFECLTGEPAFAGEDVQALLVKILIEEVPRVGELCAGVPAALEDLLARMLAKDPDQRPRDGARVASALAAIKLHGPPSSNPKASPRPGLSLGEQRLLSVVLCAGEPTAVAAVAQTLSMDDRSASQETLRRVSEAHGARLEVFSDGSLSALLSGNGIATDQAVQAARCALALFQLLPERPMALATGRGEVSGRLPVGEVMERAASMLRDREGAPRIAVDEVTAGLLDLRFEVASGEAGLELRAERELFHGARSRTGKPAACVGREREIATLKAIFAECIAEPVTRVALVTAPAGVGKSRVAFEFVAELEQRGEAPQLWFGRGDPMSAGSAFAVLGQVIRRAAGLLSGEPLATKQQKLRARVARHIGDAEGARAAEFLGEIAGVPFPEGDRGTLRAARRDASTMEGYIRKAWVDFVTAECNAAPLLIVLEDLHAGDLPTIELIDHALRAERQQPLMVLALARPEVYDIFPRLWANRGVQEIRLPGLTPKASERLVRQVLGADASAALVQRLVQQADGHAFYLEELIRAAAEGKRDPLPGTVVAMLEARLSALSPEARRVLRAASIFGDVFWKASVAALLDDAGARAAGDQLADLVEREILVRREVSRFPGEKEYGFRRGLLREGASAMLTDEDRRLGHRLAGAWLERMGEADGLKVAEHFERGGEQSRAAGWYARAAEQSLRGGDLREARASARILELSRERLTPKGSAAIAEGPDPAAHLGEAEAALADGDVAAAMVRARVRLGSEPLAEPKALGAAASLFRSMGQRDAAEESLRRMEQLAASLDRRAFAWLDLARAERARDEAGDPFQALRFDERALSVFSAAGEPADAALAGIGVGLDYCHLGAHKKAEQALRGALAAVDPRGTTSLLATIEIGRVLADRWALGEARDLLEDAREAARAHGNHYRAGLISTLLGRIHLRRGDLVAAEREAMAALELLSFAPLPCTVARSIVAMVRLGEGKKAEALVTARKARAEREALGAAGLEDAFVRLSYLEALIASDSPIKIRVPLSRARHRLLAAAAQIDDNALCESFLQSVPEHARTLDLAHHWLGE